jgi:hypothetical protein
MTEVNVLTSPSVLSNVSSGRDLSGQTRFSADQESPRVMGTVLVPAMRESPSRGFEIEPPGMKLPVRDLIV